MVVFNTSLSPASRLWISASQPLLTHCARHMRDMNISHTSVYPTIPPPFQYGQPVDCKAPPPELRAEGVGLLPHTSRVDPVGNPAHCTGYI